MSFTDENLKRLREYLYPVISSATEETEPPYVCTSDVKALLARLETAESCIFHDPEQCEYEHSGCYQCKKIKVWQKAAGK